MRKNQKSQFWLCLFGSVLGILPGVSVWKTKDNAGLLLNGGGRTLVREDTEKAKLPNTFLCISLHWQDQSSTFSDPGDWVKRSIGRLSLGQGRIGLKNTYINLASTWMDPDEMHPQVLWELMDTTVRLLKIISGDRERRLRKKANVTPVVKKCWKLDPGYYWPVSLTSPGEVMGWVSGQSGGLSWMTDLRGHDQWHRV